MAQEQKKNTYTIHLCKQGKEFQKLLDFAGLFKPIVGALIGGKWKIVGVTISGPREAYVDVEEIGPAQGAANPGRKSSGR